MAVGHIRKNQVKTPLMNRHQTRLRVSKLISLTTSVERNADPQYPVPELT